MSVLLIEDDPDYALLMNVYLNEACGDTLTYLLEFADTLEAAIELLSRKDFDIVLLDLMLPDSSGLETLERLRSARGSVPIVVLTNLDQEKFGLEAIANGAQDFLVKSSVDAKRLRHAIGYAFERSRVFSQMEGLVEASPDGMVIVDRDGIVRYVNAAVKRIFGRDPKTMIGRAFEHPLRANKALQVELACGSGEKRAVEIRAAPVDWKGERALLANLRDITDLKKLERLRAEVKESRRMDLLKDRVLSTVSHELRTPLTIIHAAIGSLRDKLAGPLTAKQSLLVGRADKHTRRLIRLLTNFLDLSRLESGRARFNLRAVDPAKHIVELVEGLRMAREGGKISLAVDIQEGVPQVCADPDILEQIVGNLLDNALRFAKRKITVRAARTGPNEVVIGVIDDGPGIPEGKIGELFEKFVQLDRPQGGEGYKGTGLGLSICKEMVAAHGGRIWAESVEGRGAGFFFTLPNAPAEARKTEGIPFDKMTAHG